jgi:tripartite-type tricarboxylate transporter receptor subunit TctC
VRAKAIIKSRETKSSKEWRLEQSEKLKKAWSDPKIRSLFIRAKSSEEVKAKTSMAIRQALASPLVRKKISEAMMRRWALPGAKEKARQDALERAKRFTINWRIVSILLSAAGLKDFERTRYYERFTTILCFNP